MALSLFLANSVASEPFSFFSELLQLTLTLLVILGLAFITLKFVRRLSASRAGHLNRDSEIKVIERRALHAKASLYLVEVKNRTIVIAESSAGIHLLSEFEKEITDEKPCQELETPSPTFAQKLKELINTNRKN